MKGAPFPICRHWGSTRPSAVRHPAGTHAKAPHMENENKPYIDMMPEDLQALIASSTEEKSAC